MTHRSCLRLIVPGLAVAALAALTACQQPAATDQAPQPGGCPAGSAPLTLVVGARMGSPRPSLPSEVRGLIKAAAENNHKIQVVRVDGQPSVAMAAEGQITAQNDTKKNQRIQSLVNQVETFVKQLSPKKPEADVLGALGEAARVTPKGGTVVLIDSGIATAGSLSFRDADMFLAEPADVAEYLASQQLLPQLETKSILLVGVGGTAEPQPDLNENLRGRVVQLWQAVAAKAGAACVGDLAVASRREAFETTVPVSVVPLPTPPIVKPCGTTVLADGGTVGFVPNTADLRDPAAAGSTLRQLTDQVVRGTQRITLVGNTATYGSEQSSRDLSLQRAEAVKKALVDLGVADERITARGDGFTGPYHRNDIGPNGVLLPVEAARNRSVVVELTCQN